MVNVKLSKLGANMLSNRRLAARVANTMIRNKKQLALGHTVAVRGSSGIKIKLSDRQY